MSGTSNMPARIWATDASEGLQMWSERKWPIYSNTRYIRADIVEAMAEALRDARDALRGADAWIAHTSGTQNKGRAAAISAVSAALNSYREASNEKA